MARKSSITRMDPRIRAAVDAAIRDGRATIADIVGLVNDLGGQVSKSSVGRYKQSVEAQMEHYRQAQALAKTWAEQLPENGDVSQLTRQILSVLAFRAANDMSDGETIEGQEVSFLARAMKDIAAATKTDIEARTKIREAMAKEAVAKVEAVETEVRAGKRVLDADTLKRIREEIYGIV